MVYKKEWEKIREEEKKIVLDQSYRPASIHLTPGCIEYYDKFLGLWQGITGYVREGDFLYYKSREKYINKINVNIKDIQPGKSCCNIPKKLHICWVGGEPPPLFYDNLDLWKSVLSSDWEIITWTNEKLTTEFFDTEYLNLINSTEIGAQKKDLIEWYVLDKLGGFFTDADIIPMRNLDELYILDTDLIVCHDMPLWWEYCASALIGCMPNLELTKNILNRIKLNGIHHSDVNMTTGPRVLGQALFEVYNEESKLKPFANLETQFYYEYNLKLWANRKSIEVPVKNIFGFHTYEDTWGGSK